mgnify:CR=1 FL=1
MEERHISSQTGSAMSCVICALLQRRLAPAQSARELLALFRQDAALLSAHCARVNLHIGAWARGRHAIDMKVPFNLAVEGDALVSFAGKLRKLCEDRLWVPAELQLEAQQHEFPLFLCDGTHRDLLAFANGHPQIVVAKTQSPFTKQMLLDALAQRNEDHEDKQRRNRAIAWRDYLDAADDWYVPVGPMHTSAVEPRPHVVVACEGQWHYFPTSWVDGHARLKLIPEPPRKSTKAAPPPPPTVRLPPDADVMLAHLRRSADTFESRLGPQPELRRLCTELAAHKRMRRGAEWQTTYATARALVTQTATNLNRRLYGEPTLAPKPKPKAKPKPRAPKAAPSPPKTPPEVLKVAEDVLKAEPEPLPMPSAEPLLPAVCRLCTVWDLPQLGDIPASGAFSLFAAMKF